ncbi:hypothetical protein KP803_09735 [Vibrio sp. ZSDE26]|uniref:Uncharacterized protein n=1 Tax=Vibrio amylolyticus TaxID=2847292 RepID=A0A9X1XIR7_9VIBR|nr:hypothetical protein [Vibrio amylolyticus]MCK6263551.1 hypothetical protein [Vibrio amylolyticus]
MMQRINVQQLNSPITDSDIISNEEFIESEIVKLKDMDPNWVGFCREKSDIAIESITFLLKQWKFKHELGFPCGSCDYIKLIERKLEQYKDVFVSFFHLAPGLVYEVRERSPETYLWLMLDKQFEMKREHLLSALYSSNKVDKNIVTLLVSGSKRSDLDIVLAEMISGDAPLKSNCLYWLHLRQTASYSLLNHFLKQNKLSDIELLPLFSLNGDMEARDELEKLVEGDAFLFERLVGRENRNTWLRHTFGNSLDKAEYSDIVTYVHILEIKDLVVFDVTSEKAPIHLAIAGDIEDVEATLAYMVTLEADEGEEWLYALYVLYGDAFPLNPSKLGIEYEWEDALALLAEWYEKNEHRFETQLRFGKPATSESTIETLLNKHIPAEFRLWIWRSLCLHSSTYFPWNAYMSSEQQKTLFHKFKSNQMALRRFDNRGQHIATLGH